MHATDETDPNEADPHLRNTMAKNEATLYSINALAEEEHRLLTKEAHGTATDADRKRIVDVEVELDRCWDLPRQRRARRSAGQDPDDASLRSGAIVENYQL
jgi:hypothetical protein